MRYEYVFDGLNRLTQIRNAVQNPTPGVPYSGTPVSTESFAYDGFGNLAAHTDANGKFAEFQYDELHRLTLETHWPNAAKPEPPLVRIVRAYDDHNNLTLVDDDAVKAVYRYTGPADAPAPPNLLRRVDWIFIAHPEIGPRIETDFRSIRYDYDACGRRLQMTELEIVAGQDVAGTAIDYSFRSVHTSTAHRKPSYRASYCFAKWQNRRTAPRCSLPADSLESGVSAARVTRRGAPERSSTICWASMERSG